MFRKTPKAEFEALVTEHYASVYRFCVRRVGEQRAADVTQEVFVSAQKSWSRFRGDSLPRTWLLGIAQNHCRHAYRHQGLRGETPMTEFEEPSGKNPEERLVDQEAVRWALNRLSPEHREVVLLHEMDGLSYDEAAVILGVPVGTVKSRLHHAMLKMRASLLGLEAVS